MQRQPGAGMTRLDLFIAGFLLAAGALAAAAYLVRIAVRGRARFDRIERQGGSIFFGKTLMEMGYWSLQPLSRGLAAKGVRADAISWSGLGVGLLGGAFLAGGHFGLGAAAALV